MTKKTKNKKKYVILLSVLVLMVGLGSYVLFQKNKKGEPHMQDTINYAPPTETEKKETDAHKDKVVEQMRSEADQPAQEPGVRKKVTPVISYWGQSDPGSNLEVGGFVQGVIEDGGECKLVLEKQGREVAEMISSKKDATSTSCSPFVVQRSSLDSGKWNAKLFYTSGTSVGESNQVMIEVK